MTIIFDGTNGITSPGGDTSNTSHSTPIVRSPSSLTLQTNGSTTAMTIDTSQNVGIGAVSQAGYGRLQVRNGFAYINEDGTDTKQMYLRTNFGGVGPAIQVATNDPLLFTTNNTERMRIDSSGRVTTPSQPAFIAYVQNEVSLAFNTTHQISQYYVLTDINTGNCYNTSNGRFTAPVTGLYLFNWKYYVYPIASTEGFLFVNNSQWIRYQMIFNYSGNTNPGGNLGSALINLNAGDYVDLRMNFNTVGGTNANLWNGGPRSSSWSGYLLG